MKSTTVFVFFYSQYRGEASILLYLFLVQLYITILLSLALDDRLIIKRKFRENDGQSWDSLIFYTLADYFYVNGKLTKIALERQGFEERPAFITKSQIPCVLCFVCTTFLHFRSIPFLEIGRYM